jgi:integrase
MAEQNSKRIVVWVQHFADRPYLMLQWHDPVTGKRKSKSAETCNPVEAEKLRADLEYELNHGLHFEGGRMPWEKFRELFEREYVAPLRPNTRFNYEDTLDLFEELCQPKRLDQVSVRTVSAFATAMRTRPTRGRPGMKPGTVKVRLQFLSTALHWAAEQGLLAKCPKFPKVQAPERKPQPVPAESFERILEKAPDANMRAYLLTGWLAGLRLSEAHMLEWEPSEDAPYLDLAGNHIVLPAGFVKGKSDQWVPLDGRLREALEALPRQGKRVFHFPAWGRGPEISASAVSDRVTRLARLAGVRLTMHTLRKGFGCRYAGKVPAQVLQKLMRHRNIRTTMDYYANVDDAVEAAVEAECNAQRNSSRNTAAQPAPTPKTGGGASPSQDEPSTFS